jgi:PAS domain S-box-containing protein
VLPEQIGEGFVREFLNGPHPVARQLLQLVEGVVVEVDQLAHARLLLRQRLCRHLKRAGEKRFPSRQPHRSRILTRRGFKATVASRGLKLNKPATNEFDYGRNFEYQTRRDARDRKGQEICDRSRHRVTQSRLAEKIYGVVALLIILTTFLVVMSIQSVRLQSAYRHQLSSSATNAINVERVKDGRNLRYVFVNRAAEKMIGRSRAEIMGKTARELFPAAAADLIEQRDRQLLTQDQQVEPIVDTIDHPINGRRTVAVRRLQIDGPDREARLLVSMIEDRTEPTKVAGAAA